MEQDGKLNFVVVIASGRKSFSNPQGRQARGKSPLKCTRVAQQNSHKKLDLANGRERNCAPEPEPHRGMS
jgi:hypothetical protein